MDSTSCRQQIMMKFLDKCLHLTGFADGSNQGLPIDGIHLPLGDVFSNTTCAIEGAQSVPNLSGDGYGVDQTLMTLDVRGGGMKLGIIPSNTWDRIIAMISMSLKASCQLVSLHIEPGEKREPSVGVTRILMPLDMYQGYSAKFPNSLDNSLYDVPPLRADGLIDKEVTPLSAKESSYCGKQ
jgi:hypothetical protein